ncbi:MAG: zinc-dependent alcohol dehydrogenase family protein [Alphaproteobacteria bacterium]|nr:zinc-dependent alcohol dehydrogenase family protein [Alphaproteobacteria bacterium]MBN9556862.1 zinc-dependent alcohol dehydrogenase family protein [Alphaproteobacteria bacterium]
MRAMRLARPHAPLKLETIATPEPGPGQIRVAVSACAVCRTDLHIVDGELTDTKLPIVPGHEIIGHVDALGEGVTRFDLGARVGVPWLGWTCGVCEYCLAGRENLCPRAQFTGYQIDGGFATHAVADERYVFAIPDGYSDQAAAPLMCAGLIGYRALKAAGGGPRLGFYGFGAAAHVAVQIAIAAGQEVYAFVRPGDAAAKSFAKAMGAVWAGDSTDAPPVPLDAAILFAPAGETVPAALAAVKPGGAVVCGGIHMSDIPSFPYALLWQERVLRSIANLTRSDAEEFLAFAARHQIHTETVPYALARANEALSDLRKGVFTGAAVIIP